jgi:nucleoside 2-deoxyribosyltransferase
VKVYLAGPMRGYPGHNHPAFHDAAAALRAAGHEVFSPPEHSPADPDEANAQIRSLLGADLAWITATAEAVVLLPGWERSKGALAEAATADAIGVRTYALADFLGGKP